MRRKHQGVPTIAVSFAVMVAHISRPSGVAVADDEVSLGGGAGIVVAGSYCTLTTIGRDKAGDLVGFTAAHCGGPGAQVVAEGAESHGPLGTVAGADADLDYAVIKFDPAKIVPVANFAGFGINGIGPDPGFGQPACIQGGATGQGCGSIKVPTLTPGVVGAGVPSFQPGDDGAPVTVDTQLVGMTRQGRTYFDAVVPRVVTHISFTLFSAIVNDTNAKGGSGCGFTPIPA